MYSYKVYVVIQYSDYVDMCVRGVTNRKLNSGLSHPAHKPELKQSAHSRLKRLGRLRNVPAEIGMFWFTFPS
eukprot:COSAG06_NODE_9387_length_1914_cov_1.361983_3_plen_72_part_00